MDRYLFKLNNKFIYTICQGVVIVSLLLIITFSWQRSPSYRNQSIDLQIKSIDWFLYDRNLRHETGKWSFRGIFKNLSNICDTVILANFFCFYPWTIFAKSSIADVCQAPKKAPVICYCIWSYSGVSMLSSLYMYFSYYQNTLTFSFGTFFVFAIFHKIKMRCKFVFVGCILLWLFTVYWFSVFTCPGLQKKAITSDQIWNLTNKIKLW